MRLEIRSPVLCTVSFRETEVHYPLKQCNRWQHTHWYGSPPSVNKVAAAPSLKFDSHRLSESPLANNSLLCHKNRRHCASFASTLAPFKSKSCSDLWCSHMNNEQVEMMQLKWKHKFKRTRGRKKKLLRGERWHREKIGRMLDSCVILSLYIHTLVSMKLKIAISSSHTEDITVNGRKVKY